MKLCLIFAVLLLAVRIHAAPITNATGQVSLAWDASVSTNALTYKIYWGVATRTYTNSVSAGTNLTCTVSNLVRGPTYFFAATALDISGLESDYSDEVSTTCPAPPMPPTLLKIITQ